MLFSKEVGESLTYKFAQAANEMKAQGREILSLGLGEPDFKTPQYVFDATVQAMQDGFTHYSATQGLPELRDLIAKDYNSRFDSNYQVGNVIVTPGIKAAVYFALASVLEPDDEVILLSPYYVSYPAMVKLAEPTAQIRYVSLNRDFTLNIEAVRNAVTPKTKCILVNSPNNPTGMVLSGDEVAAICRMAKEHDFYIISDEVYEKLAYRGTEIVSFAEHQEIADRLIVCNGYSKSHAMTGWRLGFAIGVQSVIAKMNKLQQHINTNTCTFIQKGACSVYRNEPDHIPPYVEALERRVAYFDESVTSVGLHNVRPKAGFFDFLDISFSGVDSNTFCAELLKKTGIATTPGVAFGADWDDHIRVSLAVSDETLHRAMELLKDYIKKS